MRCAPWYQPKASDIRFTPVLTLLVLVGISKSRYMTITVPRCAPWYHVETINQKQCALCSLLKASDIRFEREVDSAGTRVAPRAKASRAFVASLCPDCIATTMALMAMAESQFSAFAGFVPLFLDCHRVSGQSLGKDWRRSLLKKIGMGQLCHCDRATGLL